MVSHAFHYRFSAAITDSKAFSGYPPEIHFTTGSTVKQRIANQDIFFGDEGCILRWIDHQPAPRDSLSHIIIGIAFQSQRDPFRQKSAKTLAGRAGKFNLDGILWQSF